MKAAKPAPEASLVDQLIAEYGTDAEKCPIELPDGTTLIFRQLQSYSELSRFNKAAAQIVRVLRNRTQASPEIRAYLPLEDDAVIAAFTIAELSVEPKFSLLDAIRLQRAPWLVSHILQQINANRMNFLAKQLSEKIESGKAESGPTAPSGQD